MQLANVKQIKAGDSYFLSVLKLKRKFLFGNFSSLHCMFAFSKRNTTKFPFNHYFFFLFFSFFFLLMLDSDDELRKT